MSKDIRKQNSKQRNKIPFLILSIVLIVALAIVMAFAINKKNDSEKVSDISTQEDSDNVEKWQEGVIIHNGRQYLFNKDIKTYLLMGIDQEEPAKATSNYIKGGQSDAMFLLVTNAADKTISVVSINRNTMTRIQTCYRSGANGGYQTAQICLQHGYGDGMSLSCIRATEAVSYLFYNLPINGYLSLRMGALPTMNDAVGGVEVTVLQDIVNKGRNVDLKAGETKTLNGNEAYAYIRSRDTSEFESATDRLRRQEQYITAYMKKLTAVAGKSPSTAVNIYESISDYVVSSIDFASLMNEIKDYSYDAEHLYTVPGETVMGEKYEEFYVDEEAFYEMILEIFYVDVTEES